MCWEYGETIGESDMFEDKDKPMNKTVILTTEEIKTLRRVQDQNFHLVHQAAPATSDLINCLNRYYPVIQDILSSIDRRG